MENGSNRHPLPTIYRPLFAVSRLTVFLFLLLTVPACPSRQSVTLALLGDLNLGRGVVPSTDSFGFLTKRLQAADLALANLESPLAVYPPNRLVQAGYNLCTGDSVSEGLVSWGLDLLSIANNHRFDCGLQGPLSTASGLEAAGLTPLGLTFEPVVRQINGLPLAFFAFDDILTPLDADTASAAIRQACKNGALVIVSVHWGAEYQAAPTRRQQTLAQRFAEAGAILLWGHHPHVLQRAEWMETADHKTLVFYSLGNALFDQAGLEDTRRSALALVTFDGRGEMNVEIIPFEIDVIHSRILRPEAEAARKINERLIGPEWGKTQR